MFHASLTQDTKKTIVENFQSRNSPLRFLVATVAFGMVCKLHGHTLLMLPRQGSFYPFSQGMDIPDIEIVVVYGVPDTVSQFYQV